MGGPGGMLGGPPGPGGGGGGGGPPVSSSQPLPSNMMPKSGGMDQQYLQQSSQIFVFSTQWANKVSAAVLLFSLGSEILYSLLILSDCLEIK